MLEVSELAKTFTTTTGERVDALGGISFTVEKGEVFSLVGPSGCGKSTTLRCIAGLERPTHGRITIDGRVVFDAEKGVFVPPDRRNLGMVFQSYAIWPHMNVFDNVAFPLVANRRRRAPRDEIRRRVAAALESVQMSGFADRSSTALSGGQQQRLAVARALVADPSLLLLDEPLSNLDVKLRHHMRFELQRIQQGFGLTTIYVTHDQEEALALSDRIAVMNHGEIVQLGAPEDIFLRPRTSFVADFIGSTNLLRADLLADVRDGQQARIRVSGSEFAGRAVGDLRVGDSVVLGIRPERIELVTGKPAGPGSLTARVVTRNFAGTHMEYVLETDGQQFKLRTPDAAAERLDVGSEVGVKLPAAACDVLPHDMDAGHAPGTDAVAETSAP
jgi:iron(III) transport system ATP-binding protein